MKVYLVILEDRHTDPQVEVFLSPETAIERAEEIVEEYDYEPEEPETDARQWLFQATLSCEGDHVHVIEAEVQP